MEDKKRSLDIEYIDIELPDNFFMGHLGKCKMFKTKGKVIMEHVCREFCWEKTEDNT